MKRSPIKKRRTKPRPGRLKGAALAELRRQCFQRDGYRCQHEVDAVGMKCMNWVTDSVADWHPSKAQMAHIVSRGRGGPDTLENVVTKCKFHHIDVEHAYGPSGLKPCPPKPVQNMDSA